MSTYKHFAVAGAGSIGRVIVEELVKKKDEGKIASIVVLTRSVRVEYTGSRNTGVLISVASPDGAST